MAPDLIDDPVRVGPLWIFADGTTLPVVGGGEGPNDPDPNDPDPDDPDPDDPDPDDPDPDDPDPDDPDPDLGDAGKRALKAERDARKKAEKELAKLRRDAMTADERKVDEAREEGKAEARDVVRRLAVQAAAAGQLKHPEDAARFLDLEQFDVGDDFTVDSGAVAAAVAQLVKDRPELAAGAPNPNPGSADGGARGGGPKQLTRDDLKGMSAEQITAAKKAGQLDTLLGRR